MLTLNRPRLHEHRTSRRQYALLMADVDRVWLSPQSPKGDASLLKSAGRLTPQEASELLRDYGSTSGSAPRLADQLDALGIAMGQLTPTRGMGRGVRSIWRSTLPVILIAPIPARHHTTSREVAEAIGYLVYGSSTSDRGRQLAEDFADHFEGFLTDL